MADAEMRAAKEAFLKVLMTARNEVDYFQVIENTLDTAYEFGRLRLLHPELAKSTWTTEDANQLREGFPGAIKQIAEWYNPLTGSMEIEDTYRAKRYCSALTFIKTDFKPLFEILESDQAIRNAVDEEWTKVWSMCYQLILYMDEWQLDRRYRKPDESEMPCLEGIPRDHKWWW
ncbi:hypothetical protein WR25_21482 [Diploscapter pachys]|uniref:Uncharacterized protein n=1 Tax=Diploscapter pachys TaxID=2018661 RepID=A0A2A2LYB8_9BILA|nr:hypothetical protein WR25_21482 [Diploscapter pachys]